MRPWKAIRRPRENVPWVSVGSDAPAPASDGIFLKSNPHPRAYGNVARFLGRYVRDQHAVTLEDAVRRLAALPAGNLKLARRGMLRPGYFADVVVFDPNRIADHATFERPHQYATGVVQAFVNGVQVVRDGQHTGAKPGRFVRGPGYAGHSP
jgi:N-acyl-D-amino-acid deacylase